MQRNNLIVFLILSMSILLAWYWYVHVYNAPTEAERLAMIKAKEKEKEKEKSKDKEKAKDKEKDKEPKPPETKVEVKVAARTEPAKPAHLGGDGFHLTVVATSRGAGIRKVILNRFKAANWRGEPTDRDLELIPDDEFAPSFRMYHFVNPRDDSNPVFGLGENIWTLEKDATRVKDKDDKILYDEVRYATFVPDLDDKVKIIKTYRLAPQEYHVTLLLEIVDLRTDKNARIIPFRYQLTGGMGLPIEGEWYTSTFRNAVMALVDPKKAVWRSLEESGRISPRKGGDRFPALTRGDNLLQYAGVANQYFAVMIVVDDQQPDRDRGGGAPDKILAWARPTLETQEVKGIVTQLTEDNIRFRDEKNEHRYRLLPRTKQHIKDLELEEGQRALLSFYEISDGTPDGKMRVATWIRIGEMLKPQFDDITVRVNSEIISLAPGETHAHQFLLYHGPVKAALLGQFSEEREVPDFNRYADTLHLSTLTDYRSDNWFGTASSWIGLTWLIIKFTSLMHWLLHQLQSVFGHGLSIVVLTVIVRACMFPISRKQALFSIKMQELAPELKKIQDRYTDDPQAKMQATQEFYRKNGINPLGSCWPVFLQMPIFLGLYFALQESIHFRLVDFLWIKSLSAPDMLIDWGESIPWISTPDGASGVMGFLYLGPYLNVLPLIAVVFMMIQQVQTMPPPTDEQQATQQKMLKFMTIFFGIMFYKVAAGLCIYFIASSLWGLAERKLLPKKKAGQDALTTAAIPSDAAAAPKSAYTSKVKPKPVKKEKEKDKESITTFDKLKALWREILKQAEKK